MLDMIKEKARFRLREPKQIQLLCLFFDNRSAWYDRDRIIRALGWSPTNASGSERFSAIISFQFQLLQVNQVLRQFGAEIRRGERETYRLFQR